MKDKYKKALIDFVELIDDDKIRYMPDYFNILYKKYQTYYSVGIFIPKDDMQNDTLNFSNQTIGVGAHNGRELINLANVLPSFHYFFTHLRSGDDDVQITPEQKMTNRFERFVRENLSLVKFLFDIQKDDMFEFNEDLERQVTVKHETIKISVPKRLIPVMYLDWEKEGYENKIQRRFKKVICDFIYYQMMKYICQLRRKEGYFINKSLIDLKSTLSIFIVKNLTNKHYRDKKVQLPYYYLGTSTEQCYENVLSLNPFSFFNDIEIKDYTYHTKGIILDTIFESNKKVCFHLDPENTKLIFFTVINLNDIDKEKGKSVDGVPLGNPDDSIKNGSTRITNNPPLPPFINTNVLKKFINYRIYLMRIIIFLKTNTHHNSKDNMIGMYDKVKQALSEQFNEIREEFKNI